MLSIVVRLLWASLLLGAGAEWPPVHQPSARATVDRAIRATGGKDHLALYSARTWSEKAVYHGTGGDPDERYEATYSAAWPDMLKVVIADYTLVVDGTTGWVSAGGKVRDITPEELAEHGEGTYAVWVLTLVPLRDKAFTLSSLGERTVEGRLTDGVRVRHDGRNDIDLFFDRASGLLAMSATRYREARTGRDVQQQTTFSNYKVVAGIQTPTTVAVTRQGTRVVDSSVEVTYRRRLDTRTFARP